MTTIHDIEKRLDKKQALCPFKHSIKEHHDEKTDDNNRGIKIVDQIPIEEVHTANDWEHADLGDDQRKQKFLRLMGVKKRKDDSRTHAKDPHQLTHDDKLSCEKKHCRSKVEDETINRDLEKQFNEGLQSKILHTQHEGLGFHKNEVSTTSTSDNDYAQTITTKFVPATTDLTKNVTKEESKS